MASKAEKAEKAEKAGKKRVSRAKKEEKVTAEEADAREATTEMAVLGELPSPEELAKYEKVIPGGAERILEIVETNARHAQESERKMVEAEARLAKVRQIVEFVLALAAGVLGGILLLEGSELAGLIIILMDAAMVVGIAIYGQK